MSLLKTYCSIFSKQRLAVPDRHNSSPALALVLAVLCWHWSPQAAELEYPESELHKRVGAFADTTVVDVSTLQPGESKQILYGDMSVLLYKRTMADIAHIQSVASPAVLDGDEQSWRKITQLWRPATLNWPFQYVVRNSQSQYGGLPLRSLTDDVLVVFGTSPQYGCHLKFLAQDDRRHPRALFFNPCHGQMWDAAGRVISDTGELQPDGYRLLIPPYKVMEDSSLFVGGMDISYAKVKPQMSYSGLSSQEKLWLAANNNDYTAAEQALAAGANANRKQEYGNSLDYALLGSSLKLIKLLVAHGARPTPISEDMAGAMGREKELDMVKELIATP